MTIEPPWPKGNGNSASYDLHCHCGLVRYEITCSPPIYEAHTTPEKPERWVAVVCNCSHCDRVGAINVHPYTKDLKVHQGKEHVVEYRSAGKNNPHFNCEKCGCFLFTDLAHTMERFGDEGRHAVNVSSGVAVSADLKRIPMLSDIAPNVEGFRSKPDSHQADDGDEGCAAEV